MKKTKKLVLEDGTEYEKVHQRVVKFREEYPAYGVDVRGGVEMIPDETGKEYPYVVFRCIITDESNDVISTGSGMKKFKATEDMTTESVFLFAETQAVGRALGFLGYVSVDVDGSVATEEDKAMNKAEIERALKTKKQKDLANVANQVPIIIEKVEDIPEGVRNDKVLLETIKFIKKTAGISGNADFIKKFKGITTKFTSLSDFCSRASKKDIILWLSSVPK